MLINFFSGWAKGCLIGGLVCLAVSAAAVSSGLAAEARILHLQCVNPVGGAKWSTVVDLEHNLVDSLPATITDSWIKWRDAKGGIYEFERATGKLQLRGASTTGGFFFHYTCQQE
jgi:hypothetical protein